MWKAMSTVHGIQSVCIRATHVYPGNHRPLLKYAAPLVLERMKISSDGPHGKSRIQSDMSASARTDALSALFRANGWTAGGWVDTVYDYNHYHSTGHECLGIISGSADVLFGGEEGHDGSSQVVRVSAGEVVLIPAGVAHKSVWRSDDFSVTGVYLPGHEVDMLPSEKVAAHDKIIDAKAAEEEKKEAEKRIAALPAPPLDPVCGKDGGTVELWK